MAILGAIMHRLAQTLINMFQGVKNRPFGRLRNARYANPAQEDSSSRHHATAGIGMVILHAVLVADHLPVHLVDQLIDSSIQVGM